MAFSLLVLGLVAFLLTAIQLSRWLRSEFRKPPNFPPGPPRFPIFGAYPLLLLLNYRHIYKATEWLARWYRTDVMGMYYGNFPAVTVHSLQHIREVLLNPKIDGRPVFELVRLRDPDFDVNGVFFVDGARWKEQRRFVLRHLRDFGFGRRFDEFEAHAADELRDFVDMVLSGPKYEHERELMREPGMLELPTGLMQLNANMFLKTLVNQRIERAQMGVMMGGMRGALHFQRNGCMFGRMFSLVPRLRRWFPEWSGFASLRESSMALHMFVDDIVQNEFRTFNAEHERHFLDRYFKAMQEAGDESSYNLNQLSGALVDFMFPSMTAISTSMGYTLKRLLLNPKVMRMAQSEIDRVVGRGRLPTLEDRSQLPYFEAMLRESLRLDTLVPHNLPHLALEDTTIGQFDIPKGTMVVTNFESMHHDPAEYPDAYRFKPERFLDPDTGAFVVGKDTTLPFGLGKRLCAGETFARNMMFVFTATILQNFNVERPKGESFAHPDRDEIPTGLTRVYPDFLLKFTSR